MAKPSARPSEEAETPRDSLGRVSIEHLRDAAIGAMFAAVGGAGEEPDWTRMRAALENAQRRLGLQWHQYRERFGGSG